MCRYIQYIPGRGGAERGTVRVKCLTQEHNTTSQTGLILKPLDPASSTLSIGISDYNIEEGLSPKRLLIFSFLTL